MTGQLRVRTLAIHAAGKFSSPWDLEQTRAAGRRGCGSFARSGSVEQVQCGIYFLYQTFDFVALVRAEVILVQPLDKLLLSHE
jgi:hypothetical protein